MSTHEPKDVAKRVEYPLRANTGIAFAWALIHLGLAFLFILICAGFVRQADDLISWPSLGAVFAGYCALRQTGKVSQLKAISLFRGGQY